MKILSIILFFLYLSIYSYAKPLIVSSIKPIDDIVKAIGKDKVESYYIIPPTFSVHLYEYKISDIKLIYKSDLFLYIGVGEPNLDKIVKSKTKGEAIKLIKLSNINLIYNFQFNHQHKEKGKSIPHPALWLDPINAKVIAKTILKKLKKIDPENMFFYQKNFEEFSKKIDFIISYGQSKFSKLENRYFISYHYTWPYFTKRFKLTYLNVVELGHGRKPTAKHILEIIKQIKKYKIKAIFAALQFHNKRYTDLIKQSTNVKIVLLDPFGIKKDYILMIKSNIDKIYENLK